MSALCEILNVIISIFALTCHLILICKILIAFKNNVLIVWFIWCGACLFSHKIKHLSAGDNLFLPVRVAQDVNILPVILRFSEEWRKHQALVVLRAVGNYWGFVFRNVYQEPEMFKDLQPLQHFLIHPPAPHELRFCPSNLEFVALVLMLAKHTGSDCWCYPCVQLFIFHCNSRQNLLFIWFKSLSLIL